MLEQWVIYDHPSDFPTVFVARRWLIERDGCRPTEDVLTHSRIEPLRVILEDRGLVCLPRYPGDDPKIVEVWT